MSEAYQEETDHTESKPLPFDLRTIWQGLRRRWPQWLGLLILSTLLGLLAAYNLGGRKYDANTLLLYKPLATVSTDPATQLQTQKDLVKLPENLQTVRKQLKLPITLEQMGAAYEVSAEEGSTILIINVKWDTEHTAVALANTLAAVFMDAHKTLSTEAYRVQLQDSTNSLVRVEQQLASTEQQLDVLSRELGPLTPEVGVDYRNTLATVESKRLETRAQINGFNQQLAELHQMLKRYATREQQEIRANSKIDDKNAINQRMEKLRTAINEDRAHRTNASLLAQRQTEMRTARLLYDAGDISYAEYQKTVAAYQQQQIVSQDSPQTQTWKRQLARLQQMASTGQVGTSALTPVIQGLFERKVDLEMERIAAQQQLAELNAQVTAINAEIQTYNDNLQRYTSLTDNAAALRDLRNANAEQVEQLQQAVAAEAQDFTLVSRATPSTIVATSNKKMLALGVAFVTFLLGAMLLLGLELTAKTIRSGAEAQVKLGHPLWHEVPYFPASQARLADSAIPADPGSANFVRVLHQQVGRNPARYLVTSTERGEGVSTVALNMAAACARLGQRTLYIAIGQTPDLTEFLASRPSQPLDAVLSGTAGLEEGMAGADAPEFALARVEDAQQFLDAVNTPQMQTLFAQFARDFDTLIMDAPSIAEVRDTSALIALVDAVVFVVGSQQSRIATIRRALAMLAALDGAKIGLVVNRVMRTYQTPM